MEELDLKEIFKMFWNKKWQIILIVIIIALIGVIYTFGFTKPMYSSSVTLSLTTSDDNTATSTTNDITVNTKMAATYKEFIKTKNILTSIIQKSGTDISEEELQNEISLDAIDETALVRITVDDASAQRAKTLVSAASDVFKEQVTQMYSIKNVQVIDEPETPTSPYNISHKKDILMFALAGIVIAFLYVIVESIFFDTTIKTIDDVEREFKMPVLASIPKYENKLQKIRGGRRR